MVSNRLVRTLKTHLRRRHPWLLGASAWLAAGVLALVSLPGQGSAREGSPEKEALALLERRCGACHGPAGGKAGLDLTSPGAIWRGADAGPVVIAGKPEESLLLREIETGRMPPKGSPRLSEAEVALLRAWVAAAKPPTPAVTRHDIIPLLYLRCTVCHGNRRQEGGLDLRTLASMLRGGKSGPAIVPGKPEESHLLKRVHSGEMPPPRRVVEVSVKPMEPAEVELLTRWIAAGAPWEAGGRREGSLGDRSRTDGGAAPLRNSLHASSIRSTHWSFRPVKRPAVPAVKDTRAVRNPVDAFLLARLEKQGLTFSPEADRLTLLRRAYFDLTGLPPSPEEARAFLADRSPDAYEKLIDRLLASPHYGERWGRHWLDLAGYSDSEGIQDADPLRPHAWRYRDYVIRSFNSDKPYNRFMLEQIAGDELADYESASEITPEMADNLIATGFLRMAADGTFAPITGFVPDRLDVISDAVTVLTSSVMGLTLRCARCHDHKFDPLSQKDYYALTAIFRGALDEHDWLIPHAGERPGPDLSRLRYLPYVSTAERRRWEESEREVTTKIEKLRAALAARAEELRGRMDAPAAKSDDAELRRVHPDYRRLAEMMEARIKDLESRREPQPLIRALWDRGEPSPAYLYRRGNYLTPGMPVEPAVLVVLADPRTPYIARPPWPGAKKTGRRLAFARWLVRPEHPLTARILVNRVWHHHFGRGLVKTLENFGTTGAPPTHPELLDWLASVFSSPGSSYALRNTSYASDCNARRPMPNALPGLGWSLKRLHRLLMTSRAYRQSSTVTPRMLQLDPENRLLSRMRLRRMEGEVLYDSLHRVAGKLDERRFGRPDRLEVRADGLVLAAGTERGWRRSIYVTQRRKQPLSLLEAFDLPQMSPNCIVRSEATASPQALQLLNNGRVHALAAAFAGRIAGEAGQDPARQVEATYWTALSRPPTAEERQLGVATLTSLRDQWRTTLPEDRKPEAGNKALETYCHALLNTAAFVHFD